MPDAITHLAGARLLGGLWTPERRAILYVGALVPDLAEKGVRLLLASGEYFAAPAHSILGATLLCGAVAILFDAKIRREAFALLWIGMMTHLALDLLKDPGEGLGVPIFFPFESTGFGLGLFRSEETLYAVPGSLALLVGLELFAARREPRVMRTITSREIAWCINAGVLAAAAVALFLYCERQGRDLNPSIRVCLVRPDEFDGRELWVPFARVIDPSTIEVQDVRIAVDAALPPENKTVSLSGVFRAGPRPRLEVREVRPSRSGSYEFIFVYIVSFAALAAVLWLLARSLRLDERPIFSPRLPWPTS